LAADLQGARQGALATVEQRIDEALAAGNFQLAAELAQKRAAAQGGGAASTGAGRPPTEAEVRQIQAYFGITEAGFGPATKAKVAELQEPFGMAADSHGWLGAKPVDTLLAGHRYQTSLHTWVDQVASTYRDDRTELNAAAGALAREDQAQIVTYTYRKAPVAASIARVEKDKWTQAEAGDPLPLIQAGNALTELPKQVGVDPQVQTEINRLKSGGDQQGREWLKQQIIERKIAYWRIRAEQGLEPAEAWDAVHYEPLRCLKNRPENQQLFTAETLQYFEAQFTWAASVHEQLGHLEAAKKEYWAAYLSGGSTKAARDKAAAARRALLDLKIVGSAGRPLWDDQDPNAVVWLIDTTKRTNLDAFVQACREQFWEKVSERVVPTPRSDLAARYQISLQSESAVAQAQQYLPALQREYRQAQLYAGSGEPLLSEPAVWNLAFLRQYLKEYTDQWDVDSGLSQAILQAVKEYLQITPAIPYELGGDGNKLSAAQYAALAAEGKPLPGIDCSGYVMQVMKRVSSLIGWTDPESAIWANSGTYLDQKEIAGCPPSPRAASLRFSSASRGSATTISPPSAPSSPPRASAPSSTVLSRDSP
jgi:hypothetical protein